MKKRSPKNKALDSFFRDLRKIKGWKLDCNDFIRLRKEDQCPLTAVAKQKRVGDFSPTDFNIAGEKLGLSLKESFAVANAADNYGDTYSKLRTRLLRACGLKEVAS